MTGVYFFSQHFPETLPPSFSNGFKTAGELTNRAIQWLKNIPQQMQNQPVVAVAVLATANVIFFTFINSCANALTDRVHSSPQRLSSIDRKFNSLLIDVLFTGSSVLAFNIFLSKITNYPLSNIAWIAITATAVAARILFFSEAAEEEFSMSIEEEEQPIHPPDGKEKTVPIVQQQRVEDQKIEDLEELFDQEMDEVLQAQEQIYGELEASKPQKIESKELPDAKRIQKNIFIEKCYQDIHTLLNTANRLINFDSSQRAAQELFLEQLKDKGFATIEGPASICQATHVTIQAAFEQWLSENLKKGEITETNIQFLAELPYTPFKMGPKATENEEQSGWKTWTANIRRRTIQTLKDTKATTLYLSYYAGDAEMLQKQSISGQEEVNTHEKEMMSQKIGSCPLLVAIPKELIGAVYFFTDREGNSYILATQENQSSDETATECWKMWFGSESTPEIRERAKKMLDFGHQNKKRVISKK